MDKIKNLSKKQKIAAISVIVLLLIVGVALVLNYTFSSNEVKTFYGVELVDEKIEDEVEITRIEITEDAGVTKYVGTVKALKDTTVNYIKIRIKDENDKEIVTLIGYVGIDMKKNEEREIDASTDADLSKIRSIEYEVVK